MRAQRREAPYCNQQDHVPGHLHSQVVSRKNEDIASLQAQVDALRADLAMYPHLDPELADLLVYAAGSLRVGMEAATPAPQAPQSDETTTGKPSSKPPRGGDPRARRELGWLVRTITRALDTFNNRRDNDWQRVPVDDSAVDVQRSA